MNENGKLSSQQLADRITTHIEELAQETDAARVSGEMLRYLEFCARFHQYSWCNTWLILMAFPHATQVAGYRKWQSMNRFVRKGEKGIPILAPILVKEKNDEMNAEKDALESRSFLCGFKVVYVFDVSQTDGEPIPDPPSWKSQDRNAELQARLVAFAQERGITVTEKSLSGDTQGVSRGGHIDLSPSSGTATLIHEIAHELLHKQEERWTMTREEKELEAEAVAYVVGRHFGLDVASSANYLAMWRGGRETILAHLERIQNTASTIIKVAGSDEQIC
jgi:antirestriction protein ArdC